MSNTLKIAAVLMAATLTSWTTSSLAANVDVSVNIGQPGYYGPLDIRDYGRPQVIYQEPRIVQRVPVQREPVYLHVPPGHAKNWSKHCARYNACGERVYFVQDSWYDRQYVPRYQAQHNERYDNRDDRYEERHDDGGKKQGKHHKNKKNGHGHDD
jgi:hypothetical protein